MSNEQDILERMQKAVAKAQVEHAADAERARVAAQKEKERRDGIERTIKDTFIAELRRIMPPLRDAEIENSSWSIAVEQRDQRGGLVMSATVDAKATLWFRNPVESPDTPFPRTYLIMVGMTRDDRSAFLVGTHCGEHARTTKVRSDTKGFKPRSAIFQKFDLAVVTRDDVRKELTEILEHIIPAFQAN